MDNKPQTGNRGSKRRPLRLGFVPLTDCAPLAMAEAFGLFRKHGLSVVLSRELGWASIREKVVFGELDAAHALAAMPLAATLGLGSARCDCLTALILSLHGNAITLSNDLWRRGVRDGATLHAEMRRVRAQKTLTFGVVLRHSSHHFLLRRWLSAAGIQPDTEVRIVVVPPPQMVANLKAGHLDGFCAGEPWNSLAVQAGAGWIAEVSAALAPGHPEKVLMVRRAFAEAQEAEHLALVAALVEAAEFCAAPRHREALLAVLASPRFVNVPVEALRPGLSGQLDFGWGIRRTVEDFFVFHGGDAHVPSGDKAAWVCRSLLPVDPAGGPTCDPLQTALRVFRSDLHERAVAPPNSVAPELYAPPNSEARLLPA